MSDALETIKNLGNKKIAILGAAGFSLLIGLIVVALSVNNSSYSPLYSNLSLEDSQKIISELESRDVKYEIAGNGTKVLVPGENVLRLRMAFAEMGLPASVGATIGYEVFDKDEQLGTSSFVQNMNQLRALEGELARTISSMQQIQQARVHLVIPKRELFKKDKNKPTASINLTMSNSETLNSGEVSAIRYLVSTAVPGLSVENITVVDSRGKLLARGGDDEDDMGNFATASQEYKVAYEKKIRNKIEELLEKFVGLGNVKAQVSADIDFDRIVTNSETYDPEGQVARSIQTSESTESANASGGGNVSVDNNLPEGTAGGASGNAESSQRIEETTNFEISKTITNHVSETGKVNKMSIAILVDGIYLEDPETGEVVYTERSPEEIEKLTNLAKSAVGFDAERGDIIEVTNLPFSPDFGGYKEESMLDFLKQDLQSVVQILVMGLVAVMVIMMVVRPLVKRALELNAGQALLEGEPGEEGQALLTGPGALAVAGPGGDGVPAAIAGAQGEGDPGSFGVLEGIAQKNKPSSVKKLNEVIEQSPQDTLAALRFWMYGDGAA